MDWFKTLDKELDIIIENALREDVGDGDHSSLACIPADEIGKAQLICKDNGVVAGVEFAKITFAKVDPTLKVNIFKKDGEKVQYGDVILTVEGSSLSILKAERLVLNVIQRMSAVATKTNKYVQLLQGTGTQILDTRKTTPGIRALEKWAVKIGGGENHRFGLYDMIMLKDNHIDFAGGVSAAINKTKKYLAANNKDLKIVVEARSLDEIAEIMTHTGIFRILIDNFSVEDTKKAVHLIGDYCATESSGGINETTIRDYALCGVNYISSGALTHSVSNMDFSLKAM
ncbi:carboxylating nicotinate-nucleotide diphosphorylase [Flavobacterium agricola]|uniref:nicotinate-nucleotide diphosphorylase (carboxylating) n=1 Tax=Flavobacterium agricola TaxID=2870839 RepID=A0ABY6M303_9FLAO|nr:carboxylating nicotinate-nucleotide diphosphorylase [Flavobacterium agricola]UYW02175.1 carboxylating nicotinate-nucleotide diphosphorylase [Flavobacterium agricola]